MAQDAQSFFEQLDKDYAKAQAGAPVDDGVKAAAAPVSTEIAPQAEGGIMTGLGEAFADTARGVAGGIESAGRGILSTGIGAVNTVKDGLAGPLRGFVPDIPNPWGEDGIAKPLIDEPKHFINKMTKSITEGAIEQIVGNRFANGGQLGMDILKSQAIGTALVADPHRENLANLIETVPSLQSPLTEWLSSNADDSFAMGKFKNILVDTFGAALGSVAFKTLALGYKGGKGQIERMFGKPVDQVVNELDAEVKGLAAQSDSLSPEPSTNGKVAAPEHLNGHVNGHYELDSKSPSRVLTMPGQKESFEKVELNKLKVLDSDHTGPMEPDKLLSLKQQLNDDATKVPAIVLERRVDGDYIIDGRHRQAAMIGNGGTTTTAKVIESADYLKAQSDKLKAIEAKAGGADKLAKVTERLKAADNAFNMTPEQYVDFQTRVQDIMKAEPGDLDNIFTKAGMPPDAFNLEKFNSPMAVKETVQAMAEVMAPQLEKNVKSYQSFKEMQLVADLLKVKPQVMLGNLETWGFNAKNMPATLLAAKNMIQSLSAEIGRDAQSIAIAGVGGHQAKIAMMQKVQALAHIEGMVKSIQTAAARTTAAGRIVTKGNVTGEQMMKMLDEFGGMDKVDQLATKLATLKGDPTKTMNMLRGNMFHKLVDAHNELWINSMLSGVATHAVNVGTAASQLFMKPFNITLGGAIRGDWESAKEGLATWRAMGSMTRDALRMAKLAWDIERPLISITDKQLEAVPTISAQNFDLDPKKWLGWGVDHLGKIARIPSRFLGAEDEFFKQLNYRASLHAGATREAMDLVKAGKLDWSKQVDQVVDGKIVKLSEVDAFIAKKFDEGFQVEELADLGKVQTRGTDAKALQYANESTFTQSLKVPTWKGNRTIAESIYQFANEHPMARGTVLPFVKVPANLLREGFSYTPVIGQMRKQFWSDLAEGGTRASEAIGRLATGSLLAVTGTTLAVNGMITGAAPTDKEIRERMFEKGWQPYSFKIGDTYIPFSRIDPYGIVFGLIADFTQITHHLNENERHSFGASFSLAMANLVNSKGYLKGLVDFLDILQGGQGEGAVNKLQKIAESWTSSHIPSVLRITQDSSMKEIRGLVDSWLARTPGYGTLYGEGLPAKRGYFGDKVWQPVGWPWSALSPIKPSGETDDPALLELARLADGPSAAQFSLPPKRLGTLDLTQFKNQKGVTAYDRMIELLNETDFHKEVNDLVTSEDYLKNGTDGDAYYPGSREIDIKKLQAEFHKEAKEKMLDEFPELRQLVEQDEDNLKASKAGDGADPLTRLLELNK